MITIAPEAASTNRRKQQVLDVLAAVRDPEIDESIGSLDFVVDVLIDAGDVKVIVRPPTAWCPSNFVFLIAEDMRAAVLGLGWVQRFKIKLLDHFAEHEIALGINEQRNFSSVFPGQSGDSIDTLRKNFDGKAFLMRQRNLVRAFQKRGVASETLLRMTIDQACRLVTGDEERQLFAAYLAKRQTLGIASDSRYLVSDLSGRPVPDLNAHLRQIKMTAANAVANGEMCRMMVAARRQMSYSTAPIQRHSQPIIIKEMQR